MEQLCVPGLHMERGVTGLSQGWAGPRQGGLGLDASALPQKI